MPWALDGRLFGGGTNIATPGPAPFLRRYPGRFHCFSPALNRVFTSLNGRAVAAEVANPFISQRILDQGFRHTFPPCVRLVVASKNQ